MQKLKQEQVFAWNDLKLDEEFRYLKIVGHTQNSYLGEIALYNNEEKVEVRAINQEANLIID